MVEEVEKIEKLKIDRRSIVDKGLMPETKGKCSLEFFSTRDCQIVHRAFRVFLNFCLLTFAL